MIYIKQQTKLLIISLFLMLMLGYYHTCQAQQTARLWKIEKQGLAASYILATMHLEDPRVVHLPKIINQYLIQAKSFVAELDLNLDPSIELLKYMMLPDNRNLKKILGDDLFKRTSDILVAYGLSIKVVDRFKPWAVLMIMSVPKPRTGLFLDKILFNKAKKLDIKIYGLETLSEQLDIFNKLSYSKQIILLQDLLNQYDQFDELIEKMTQLYLKGDLEGLLQLNRQQMNMGNIKVTQEFMFNLIDKRNITMVKRMLPLLVDGRAFIAVGALHLPGQAGILQLLRNRKFKLTAIY